MQRGSGSDHFHCAVCLDLLPFCKRNISSKYFAASNRFSFMSALYSIHLPNNSNQISCLCWSKESPHHDAAPTMFHCRDGMLRVFYGVFHVVQSIQSRSHLTRSHNSTYLMCVPHVLLKTLNGTSYDVLSNKGFLFTQVHSTDLEWTAKSCPVSADPPKNPAFFILGSEIDSECCKNLVIFLIFEGNCNYLGGWIKMHPTPFRFLFVKKKTGCVGTFRQSITYNNNTVRFNLRF